MNDLPDLPEMLRIALRGVDAAEEHMRTHTPTHSYDKADRDPVTDLDVAIERLLRGHLSASGINVDGEEEGICPAPHRWPAHTARWVLDPIDGTANYWRGLPLYGISLALIYHGRPVAGVIALPGLRRRYWAAEGHGAYRDGIQIHAAVTRDLGQAVVAVGDYGFGPDAAAYTADCLALHQRLAPAVRRIRMLGSAAVDLAFVADGTLDAAFTVSNHAWDTAAGVLIAREAGAVVVDHRGSAHTFASTRTYAVAPHLEKPLLTLLTTGDTT